MAPNESNEESRDLNHIIQGLWVGAELSLMEQLSLASFRANNHEYHLYVYDEPRHVPSGIVIRDAAEILPSSRIFLYQKQYPSYAGFSNFFRYKLLLERGGWWADTDTICLKHWDFTEPHVFSTEICEGRPVINCGAIKVPQGSQAMAYAWEICQTKDPEKLVWGETGPRLMGEAVRRHALEAYAQPPQVFCPLGYEDWRQVLAADTASLCHEDSYAIHLWNEMWRKVGQDKNAPYPQTCLYEQLKRKYL